MSLIMMKK